MKIFLELLKHEIHLAGLMFLGTMYVLRIIWLFRFRFKNELTIPAGNAGRAAVNSVLSVVRPWGVRYRNNRLFYFQFFTFHLGIAAAISATFIIPYKPDFLMNTYIKYVYQVLLGCALVIGLFRLYRRVLNPVLRKISTPDDYFSIIIVILFFSTGILVVTFFEKRYENMLLLFFSITVFLHAYVPFSKIIHYLYYPFMRYYLGKTLGHRNIDSIKI